MAFDSETDSLYLASIAKTNKVIVGLLIALLIMFLIPLVISVYTTVVAIDAAKHLSSLAQNTKGAGVALFHK